MHCVPSLGAHFTFHSRKVAERFCAYKDHSSVLQRHPTLAPRMQEFHFQQLAILVYIMKSWIS